jgi:hypothetical protein
MNAKPTARSGTQLDGERQPYAARSASRPTTLPADQTEIAARRILAMSNQAAGSVKTLLTSTFGSIT